MYESPDPSVLNTLSPNQQEVLRGLVAGQSISAAARTAGVHRATVYLWMRTVPTFTRALDAHQRLRTDRLADDLNDLTDSALGALRQILDNPDSPAAVRYRAAIAILDRAQQFEESRLYRDSHLLSDLHTQLPDSRITEPVPPESPAPESEVTEFDAPEFQVQINSERLQPVIGPILKEPVRNAPVRNLPCPCGSHLKYKRCCGKTLALTQAA